MNEGNEQYIEDDPDANEYCPLAEIESPTQEEIERVFAESNKKLRDSLKEMEESGKVETEYINGVAVYFRKRTR